MKKIIFILILLPVVLQAQDDKLYNVSISGHVSYEMIFDTRQTVTARDGDVMLYPKPIDEDLSGIDINKRSSFNMFAIHSRLRTKVSGPDMFGAKTSALVETDFVGISDIERSSLRLRHAIIKLDWEKSSLMLGKYWHPMFVVKSFPEVSSWGGGLPYAILSRNPQIRFKYKFNDNFSASITALTQSTFSSPGPNGTSPEYLKNSSKPEFDLHLQFSKNGWLLGTVAGVKELRPRLQDANGQAVDETISSAFGSFYARKDWKNFTAKIKGIYGQNIFNFVMLGGYASFQLDNSNKWVYSNYETGSIWTEFIYTHKKFFYGLYAGYTENFGLDTNNFEGMSLVDTYARATNVAYAYRISPRIGYKLNKFLIMGEVLRDVAAYGEPQINGDVINTKEVGNFRIQMHFKYLF